MNTENSSVRSCAYSMLVAIEAFKEDSDVAALKNSLLAAINPVINRPDLFTLGTYRRGNHISNSKYLYYDGDLVLTLDEFPKGKFIPPHDHGVWEAIALCRGRMQHTVYDRVDDGSLEGHAKLIPREDFVMCSGDIAMVMPPNDIHSFQALEESTFGITIVGGEYSLRRHYYDTSNDTYVIAKPKGASKEVET
jgi:predicted metal-dependent enzyme (double-stranded beta helix superfamily)